MKKRMLVLLVLGMFLLSSCNVFATKAHDISVKNQACFDMNGLINKDGKCVLNGKVPAATVAEDESIIINCNSDSDCDNDKVVNGDQCLNEANSFGIPIDLANYICTMPQNNPVAPERMKSKDKITFGSITFDDETRVWVLRNFIVPGATNYSFDHSGRERRILGAGFYTGSALSPVNDLPFVVCYNTTSEGCIPPHNIQFFD